MRYLLSFLALWAVSSTPCALAETSDRRAFTVADSIGMIRLVAPDAATASFIPAEIETSPDGRFFVIATRRGNLETGKNDYILHLYRTEDARAYLNAADDGRLPVGKPLVTVSTSLNETAFQNIVWLDEGAALGFIGWFEEHGVTPGQVYTVDVPSGQLTRLTDHPRPVTDFALNLESGTLVFVSTLSTRRKDRDQAYYLAGVRHINGIVNPAWENPYKAFQYYIQDIEGETEAKAVGDIYRGIFPTPIWLAPDGGHAVVLTTKKEPPRHWVEGYQYLQSSYYRTILSGESTPQGVLRQFSLIDVANGKIRPIFDAPVGMFVSGYIDAAWLPDSRSVVLGNTALPLDVEDVDEKRRRSQVFFTVEYHVATGRVMKIDQHDSRKNYRSAAAADYDDVSRNMFMGLSLRKDGWLEILEVDERRQDVPPRRFKRGNGAWVAEQGSAAAETASQDLILAVVQSLESAPEVAARDPSSGRERTITDLNPQFRKLAFGKVDILEWQDRTRRIWRGGLVYPPSFKEGTRYPLVIQAHGFLAHEFLVDGPYQVAGPFAAQALANRDMVVLQMASPGALPSIEERSIYQNGFEAAIDLLHDTGLIDRERVGLIGWSASGVAVQHMLLQSPYPTKAAVVADAFNFGLLGYVNQFGSLQPGMGFIEDMIGGYPWGDGLDSWVANNPELHLDRMRTPLRYEQYAGGLSSWWSIYTVLKRLGKPVEYYVFRDAAHVLVKPEHIYASQQGTVDWFAFWLNGEEDPNPAKADQYARWRTLRAQQPASEAAAVKARQRHKPEARRRADDDALVTERDAPR